MNAAAETTRPWGYGTFGATRPIIGYWDSLFFGSDTFGAQSRYPYKASQGNQGGHFGASYPLSPTDTAIAHKRPVYALP